MGVNRLALFCSIIVLLSISVVSHAGVTSNYTRVAEPSEEMPLETFPPPAGYNAPEQVIFRFLLIRSIFAFVTCDLRNFFFVFRFI